MPEDDKFSQSHNQVQEDTSIISSASHCSGKMSGIEVLILAATEEMKDVACLQNNDSHCVGNDSDIETATAATTASTISSTMHSSMSSMSLNTIESSNSKKSTCTTTSATTSSSTKRHQNKLRSWDDSFVLLCQYKDKVGHTNVPVRYKPDTALANWVRYQQRNFGQLTKERRAKLDAIGFQFGARNDRQWKDKFQRLRQYYQEDGFHTAGLFKYDVELSQWVSTQRTLYKKGLLRQDRLDLLDSIGFLWQAANNAGSDENTISSDIDFSGENNNNIKSIKKTKKPNMQSPGVQRREAQWKESYKKLKVFYAQHGHFHIPNQYDPDPSLGIWVSNQRSIHNRGQLAPRRKQLLDDIGFVWRVEAKEARAEMYQRQWDEQLENFLLRAQQQQQRVPNHIESSNKEDSNVNDGQQDLQSWITQQKEAGRKGTLDAKRAERLLSAGLSWGEERTSCWTKSYIKLKDVLEAATAAEKGISMTSHGDGCFLAVQDIASRDAKLANWMELQVVMKKHKKLSLKREYLFQQMGISGGTTETPDFPTTMDTVSSSTTGLLPLKKRIALHRDPDCGERPLKKARSGHPYVLKELETPVAI